MRLFGRGGAAKQPILVTAPSYIGLHLNHYWFGVKLLFIRTSNNY